MKCPRCDCKEFDEIDCGPDSYEDDVTYTSEICKKCKLYHSGWNDKWLIDCENWKDEENAEEYYAGLKDKLLAFIKFAVKDKDEREYFLTQIEAFIQEEIED